MSTLTERFFRDHLHVEDGDMHCTAEWLKITAPKKLPLPYLGYVELDMQVMGLTIPEYGFLIITESESSLPGITGLIITKRCRQLVLSTVAEFDRAPGGGFCLEGGLPTSTRGRAC